ncbi:hypothetical protein FEM48_Zijuj11G0066800 [Ziziphus jujuba var. spinosa]|uniref:Plastocyanin-like domain-containing protein n=1 Tax=Ziziphus jujuba var. spinosa TaxID=714518 RepID=A0A978UHF0_ZIZJJ|nr:hypothetical protein FEM48_Zijuj11G0066800 [Ziziphus jujuba var. spinosa]
MASNGTRLVVLPFNTSVELVMQDTTIIGAETTLSIFVDLISLLLAKDLGILIQIKTPSIFNLVDPIDSTLGVPSSGWVAIRFLADNLGVWFMHCHLEIYTSWGLKMA